MPTAKIDIHLWVEEDLKNKIADLARADDRSLNSTARRLLKEALRAREARSTEIAEANR